MASAVQDWRVDLTQPLPDFFAAPPGRRLLGKDCQPRCGEGWRGIIDRCCVWIGAVLRDHKTFYFERIRERHGSVRIYSGGRLSAATEAAVREAIDLAEARSQCICELCGGEGRLYESGDVLSTRCAEHADGNPVPVRHGFENVHLTQKTVTGRVRVVVCRHYDPEEGAFVDFDPSDPEERD